MKTTFSSIAGIASVMAIACTTDPIGSPEVAAPPHNLRDTGLYADWESKQVAASHLAFTPQYPLWSDGAAKQRWIALPPGTSIDASDPDAWEFPIGTRVWKQFAFHGARVETRFMVRTRDGWQYATYVWSADQRDAVLAPATGVASVELAPGIRHQIPSESDCRACHARARTPVLGFSALQLSPDRDPLAIHREQPAAGAVDLNRLVASALVRGVSPALIASPPRIPGPPMERAARGYLHANCGGCHRTDSALATVGMVLAHSLQAPDEIARTTFGQPSQFMAPAARIAPGDADHSVVLARMRARTPLAQMPPLGTQLVDTDATRLVADWIDQLAEYPQQGNTQ